MSERPTRPPAPEIDERFGRQLLVLTRAINQTPGRLTLYLLSAMAVAVIIATAGMQVALNAWNRPFYDAIERKELGAFLHQLVIFFGIAGVLLILNVGQAGLYQLIRLKLRELATKDLIANWMTQKRAARISRAGEIGINPDQRIHADTQHLTELTTDLGLGLLQASILLLSFIGVLWVLSRGIVLHLGGVTLNIPGYMVWAALIYAISGSWLSWRIGRPLVRLQAAQYAREADFRFALVQGSEQADGIALNNGEPEARRQLGADLDVVLAVLRRIVLARVRLTWVTAGYGWVALVVPIIVAAPGYFGGHLSFGELMMVVGAFNQVQQALRWFIDNTGVIADWRATLLRVMTFRQALFELDRIAPDIERFERVEDPQGHLVLDNLVIKSFRGWSELSESHLEVGSGERVLIVGKSGAGKSTLFLSIAGLWNWGTGRIGLPPAGEMMFLSQRPFLPAGSLRAALTYATGQPPHSDAELKEALRRVGLVKLTGALDREEDWAKEISPGEQERLAFARLLVIRPKWVVSDDALDLLDEGNRRIILSMFQNELAHTALISIAGTSPADRLYSRVVRLIAHPTGKGAEAERPGPEALDTAV